MHFTHSEIIKIIKGEKLSGDSSPPLQNLSTDSRNIQKGDYFLCLVGEKFNGHDFIKEVSDKGAAAIILEKKYFNAEQHQNLSACCIGVEDTLKALGDLAQAWRQKFSIPVLGIAGSNGKTSTKEMAHCVLSEQFNTLATSGNFNNLIGVPKMIFQLNEKHEAAIFELGMNDFGELKRLTEISQPTLGLITNIGLEHLEKLKNLEGVAKAEGELFETLPSGTLALVNADDAYISAMPTRAYRISYGMEKVADVFCIAWEFKKETLNFEVKYLGKKYAFSCQALGIVNLKNALAAVAVGFALAIPAEKIQRGLQKFKPASMRMELIELKKKKILNDCYNANPSSMEMALKTLAGLKCEGPRLAILGEMLELGNFVVEGHQKVGKAVAQNDIDFLISIGPFAKVQVEAALSEGMNENSVFFCENFEEAKQKIMQWSQESDCILIKGSRGSKMERATELLKGSS